MAHRITPHSPTTRVEKPDPFSLLWVCDLCGTFQSITSVTPVTQADETMFKTAAKKHRCLTG